MTLNNNLKFVLAALACALGMMAGAAISIDLPYVPLTMQTFFLCLSALFLAPAEVFSGQLLYLCAGLFWPVFSGDGYGIEVFTGFSSGYLLAFPPVAFWLAGRPTHRKSVLYLSALSLVAHMAILAAGWLWLTAVSGVFIADALRSGFVNLLPGALIKSVGVAVLYRLLISLRKSNTTQVQAE